MSTLKQILVGGAFFTGGWLGMELWNGVASQLGGPVIDYWQSMALMFLGRIYTYVPPSLFGWCDRDDLDTP